MKKKQLLFLNIILFLCVNLISAQKIIVYEEYPYGQEGYLGGKSQLYKEIHQVLIENKIEKCEDSTQNYKVKVLVKQDASIAFVANLDSVYVNKNKCAYDLSKKVLVHLKNWKPAENRKKKLNAIYEFDFIPSDLFDDYVESYIGIKLDKKTPQFPGGINEFRKKVSERVGFPSFRTKGSLKIIVFFVINKEGFMENIVVKSTPFNPEFEKKVKDVFLNLNETKWILPENYHLSKELFRMNFPMSFKVDGVFEIK